MAWDDLHDPKGSSDDRKRGGGSGGGGGGPAGKPPFDIPPIKMPQFNPTMFVGVALVLLVVWILPGAVYFVEPDEEGVVTRFGKFIKTTQPGMHFKFPSPIDHAQTPKVRKIQRAEIGFRSSRGGGPSQQVQADP